MDESVRNWDNWDNQDTQACGNLMLYISPDIRNLVTKERIVNTKELLDWLKAQYGTASIAAAYTDIVAVNKLQVPGDGDPTPAIDKLLALFTHLKGHKFIYAEPIQAMTLLAKLPPQMEEIVCNYNSKTSNATLLSFSAIQNNTILNWQQQQQYQGSF